MDELLHHDAIIRERIIGKSVRAIAQDHGCSIAEVNKALDLFAVATINARVRTHALALELSRLDELQSVFYERAKAGDVASGMLLTKIMERSPETRQCTAPEGRSTSTRSRPAIHP